MRMSEHALSFLYEDISDYVNTEFDLNRTQGTGGH